MTSQSTVEMSIQHMMSPPTGNWTLQPGGVGHQRLIDLDLQHCHHGGISSPSSWRRGATSGTTRHVDEDDEVDSEGAVEGLRKGLPT